MFTVGAAIGTGSCMSKSWSLDGSGRSRNCNSQLTSWIVCGLCHSWP